MLFFKKYCIQHAEACPKSKKLALTQLTLNFQELLVFNSTVESFSIPSGVYQ